MRRVYILLLVLCIVSCAPPLKKSPAETFGETHSEFAKRLTWQDYGSAASFLGDDYRQDFQEKFPERGDIRVLEIRPAGVEFEGPDRKRAISWSAVDYYRLPSNTLKNLKVRLEWEYFNNGWKIVSPFPDLP